MSRPPFLKDIKKRWRMAVIAVSLLVAVLFLASSFQPATTGVNTATPADMQGMNYHHHGRMTTLSGNVPYMMQNQSFSSDLQLIGPAPGNAVLTLTLYLGFNHMGMLQWYVNQVNNPNSVLFHHYMSPSQFNSMFYPSHGTVHAIENYYSHEGFRVWNYNYAPTVIVVQGNVSLVESAFHVSEYLYKFLPNNAEFITNTANPSVPSQFHSIFHVYGLSYSSAALLSSGNQKALKTNTIVQGQASGPAGNSYILTPTSLSSFYQVNKLFAKGYNGTNTKIGILGVGESVNMNAVSMFWNGYGIHNPTVKFVNLTANGQNPYSEGFESDLDVEWSGAMAPQSTIYDVMQPFNLTGIGNNAVNLELYYMLNVIDPNVISGSWAELQFHHDSGFAKIYTYIGLQAAAEGITVFLGSGDSHDINYLTVMASKYIVSVGGVYPIMNDTGVMTNQYAWYQPIYTWYGGALGSGGGSSFFFAKPAYQKYEPIKVPNAYKTRGQPDIAMPASNLITNVGGNWYLGGGTSYATPITAGIFASMESGMHGHYGQSVRLGWIQPMLYNLGYGHKYGNPAYYQVNYLQPGPWLTGSGYLGHGWNEFTGIGSLQTYNLYRDIQAYETPHNFFYNFFR